MKRQVPVALGDPRGIENLICPFIRSTLRLMDQMHASSVESERLTWDQICRRYVDEWVVLVDTDWVNDTDFDFRAATVFGHAQTRKAASPLVKNAFQTHETVGCFFTGPLFGPTI